MSPYLVQFVDVTLAAAWRNFHLNPWSLFYVFFQCLVICSTEFISSPWELVNVPQHLYRHPGVGEIFRFWRSLYVRRIVAYCNLVFPVYEDLRMGFRWGRLVNNGWQSKVPLQLIRCRSLVTTWRGRRLVSASRTRLQVHRHVLLYK